MIPSKFNYYNGHNLTEVLNLLNSNEDVKIISGGHSLVPMMKLRMATPESLVSISKITSLKFIKVQGNELIIGTNATHDEIANSFEVKKHLPILSIGASTIGDIQVRNFGTIGGNIAHADPAADWPTLLLATEATICVESKNGKRNIQAQDFFQGFFTTALADNEIITEIKFNIPPDNTKSTYVKFYHPASKYAVVGCAAMVTKSKDGNVVDAKVAFTSVSACQFRSNAIEQVLIGKALNEQTINEAVKNATKDVDVSSDVFASEEYKKHLAQVMAKRALIACI